MTERKAQELLAFAMKLEPEDAQALFDTGVFNAICKAYTARALDRAGADPAIRRSTLEALTEEFEFVSAAEAMRS